MRWLRRVGISTYYKLYLKKLVELQSGTQNSPDKFFGQILPIFLAKFWRKITKFGLTKAFFMKIWIATLDDV